MFWNKIDKNPSNKANDKHTLENQTGKEESYREKAENHLGDSLENCEHTLNPGNPLEHNFENKRTKQKIIIKEGKDKDFQKPIRSLYDPEMNAKGNIEYWDSPFDEEAYAKGDYKIGDKKSGDLSKDLDVNTWYKEEKRKWN